MTEEDLKLIHGYLNGTLQRAEFARLQSLLREQADARRMLRSLATVETKLHQLAAGNTATLRLLADTSENDSPSALWFSRRPAAAAVAGLLLGLLCATMVFAYIAPAIHRPILVLETSFEDVSPAKPLGVPDSFGTWGGDYSEIVGTQNGVTPRSGAKMWRFLRADNAQQLASPRNYVGEAIYVLDLRNLRSAPATAVRHLEISAWFAHGATAPDSIYHWNIKAAAFEGNVSDAPKLWGRWDEASASLVRHEAIAQSGAHWQPLSVTVAIPAHASFLVFECAVVQRKPFISSGSADFPAHYLDDVRVRLLASERDMHP